MRFLLGPAGSGKTFRCLAEIRRELSASPDGPSLALIAPKQATYQVEQQLLSSASLRGYTRLNIFSFERLAHFVLEQLGQTPPDLLSEEGRVMVLRALIARKRQDLKLFRASARLNGFAQQLSQVIGELQRNQLTPEAVRQLAAGFTERPALCLKLQDLAELMREYVDWLAAHGLQDRECLLSAAIKALHEGSNSSSRPQGSAVMPQIYWLDGFAEFSEAEVELLAALLPGATNVTIAFCLPELPRVDSWLSDWSVVRRTFENCRARLATVTGAEIECQWLGRNPATSRFGGSPALRYLEEHWTDTEISGDRQHASQEPEMADNHTGRGLRLALCPDPEIEVLTAAREILGFVRSGGRYREAAVLVRNLENYFDIFQRVFTDYQIPFFLDRRQPVAHHPIAELTRSALRTTTLGWQHEDWFAALKTGFMPARDEEIDQLENEALARGWKGAAWQRPLRIYEMGRTAEERERLKKLESRLEKLRSRLMAPFQTLALALATGKPTGAELAAAIRKFWATLDVERRLQDWAASAPPQPGASLTGSIHETVWTEMNDWLENVELAFAREAMPTREWLQILESGLARLTVGLIPPALDQVLIGAIDRSRNPDLRLAIVLGMNETVFPAAAAPAVLLTESDRAELEKKDISLGLSHRQQLSRERYFAYIACTRARERLVLTCAARDRQGAVLNPSPFLRKICRLFPDLRIEPVSQQLELSECFHSNEVFAALATLVSSRGISHAQGLDLPPAFTGAWKRIEQCGNPSSVEQISPELAVQLYGKVLRTSVSRLEQFAACQFRFFVHSGLRAEERKRFELDLKEQGSFQHEVLALFHDQLGAEHKRWRDITPAEARERIAAAAQTLIADYREGLLQADEQTRFLARNMTESLQDFVEILVEWMQRQYRFDPVKVELPFGENELEPVSMIDLGDGHQLRLRGRIDRVDLAIQPGGNEALCVVVDYKSSQKELDPLLIAHGLQLQLLGYLDVLRRWPNPEQFFGAARLIPAGVFYVNLRGKYEAEKNRLDALDDVAQSRKLAYRHSGRFDIEALPYLDHRSEAKQGDQFNYRRTAKGDFNQNCREALASADFLELLNSIEANLRRMGQQIYSGAAKINPYRKGSTLACDRCGYQWICRIDPWTHRYRTLPKPE